VFKKCREDSGNILFIDASNEFEKVKAQNYLTDENVAKIIDTFKSRETIDKHSYLASLDEVKENDYNLNIPRYVDTFEEEVLVDLDAVSAELKAIDTDMADTDNIITSFCDELSIAKPF
jgi:type I restriction enzyme M protein